MRLPRALLDAALAVAVFAVSLALLAHSGAAPIELGSHGLDPAAVALAACSALPLVAWRRFPLGVFVVTAATSVLLAVLDYPVSLLPGPAVALYLLAAQRKTPALVAVLFAAYLGAIALAFSGIELLHAALPWAVGWFAGERTRLRRARVAEGALLAVAQERARIARDLHDSAGHAISLIAVRAGAARLRQDLGALQAIEELARQTAGEIDQIVGTLRESNSGIEAPIGLASLDTLIAHHVAAGLSVTLDTVGAPQALSGAADQAAYRILQQALTNAADHGSGSAHIELRHTGSAVELVVTNPVGTARPRGGHGLIGMRERATLLGGSLEVTRADGTFRVHATIPTGGRHA